MRRLAYSPSTIVLQPNIFGDGSWGDGVISGTVSMTEPRYYRRLTIMPGAILRQRGYPIFVQQTLLNQGTIHSDGNAPIGNNGGIAAGIGSKGFSGSGANARTSAGVGADAPVIDIPTGWDEDKGVGGSGGAAGGNAGGAGGNWDGPMASIFQVFTVQDALAGGIFFSGATGDGDVTTFPGGSGGGAGGFGAGAAGASGAGGGGGACSLIVARQINNVAGIIRAAGGAGGNASGTGNIGGGGGGGGGTLFFVCLTIAQGTINVSGGAGGSGIGTGSAGLGGQDGNYFIVQSTGGS